MASWAKWAVWEIVWVLEQIPPLRHAFSVPSVGMTKCIGVGGCCVGMDVLIVFVGHVLFFCPFTFY